MSARRAGGLGGAAARRVAPYAVAHVAGLGRDPGAAPQAHLLYVLAAAPRTPHRLNPDTDCAAALLPTGAGASSVGDIGGCNGSSRLLTMGLQALGEGYLESSESWSAWRRSSAQCAE